MEEKNYLGMGTIWERFLIHNNPISIATKCFNKDTEEYVEAPHFHDFPQLWYCIEGYYTHTVNNISYECSPGSLIIIPTGTEHSFKIKKHSSCQLVQANVLFNFFNNFSNDDELLAAVHLFLPNFAQELKFTPQIHIVFTDNEKNFTDDMFTTLSAINWVQQNHNFQSHKKLFLKIFSNSDFSLSQAQLLRARKFIDKKYIPLLKTVYFMNLNYGRKIYRNELIELSGICQTDYFRYIKRILGHSFSTYLQRIRVRHAIILSTFSPYSLSYIADICGFGDLTYMENRIKKFSKTAKLPSDMRKERKHYIELYPFMIKTREDYEKLPHFFNSFGL